jgi:cytochrome c-type biogenesis protein CcmH/NrfG
MSCRKYINALVIVFATIMTFSFVLGTYMLVERNGPVAFREAAVSATVPELGTDVLLGTAKKHLETGEIEQALIAYRQVLSADPKSVDAQLGLARGELKAGREDVAEREFARVLELDPLNAVGLLELARIHSHRSESWPSSEVRYREYLQRHPNDAEAWLELARILAWQKKSAEAAGAIT